MSCVSLRWSQHTSDSHLVTALWQRPDRLALSRSQTTIEALNSRLYLSHHHHRRRYLQAESSIGTRKKLASSNPICLRKKLARIPPLVHPQAQQNVKLRTHRELDRQVHPGQSRNWPRYAPTSQCHPQAKAGQSTSHSAIFHNHVFASPPSWLSWTIQTPRSRGPFRFLPRP